MLKRIPKKTTPTKVRVTDADLDKVPVTKSISVDTNSNGKTSMSLKRPSDGKTDIPEKKAKIVPTNKPTVGPTIKKSTSVTSRIVIFICFRLIN